MSRRSGNCGRCCLVVFAVVSALCVSGPAIYWKFKKSLSLKTASLNSCSPCICDCAPPPSLLKIAPACFPHLPTATRSLLMIATNNLEYGLGNIGSPLNSVA
nr:uncharacterized protein LOC113696022 isoform X2 [Coffea arabica]